jgi:hypothetical protein
MCNTGKKSKTMVEERKLDSPKGDAAAVARGQKEKNQRRRWKRETWTNLKNARQL